MHCQQNSCVQQNILPKESKYFKEELVSEILIIPPQKPEMERILDIMVWPEVVNIKLVDTPVGMSNEGQYLSGHKLVIEINLKEKVTYVACEPTQSVHAAHFETMKSVFVILPSKIDEKNICDLIRADRIQVTPYIEAIKFRMLDTRTIHKCVMLFTDVKIF